MLGVTYLVLIYYDYRFEKVLKSYSSIDIANL